MSTSSLPGALVVSLDFELGWGFDRNVSSRAAVRSRIQGAREAIPRLLDLFEEFEIAASWAIVGCLFAESKAELEGWRTRGAAPFRTSRLSPLPEEVGDNEREDPLHFAPSLIRAIRETPRQEIGTHTFSHHYCLEPNQTEEDFAADLRAASLAAREFGVDLRSIVFPRNQHNPAYDRILLEHGITAYRGNPVSWAWQFGDTRSGRNPVRRTMRFVDTYCPIGMQTNRWEDVLQPSGLSNVRSSRPLAPYRPAATSLERLRMRRIRSEIHHAAMHRELYHIWWHPHNFGSYTNRNLSFLRELLEEVTRFREEQGLLSLSMADVDQMVRERNMQFMTAPAESG